MINTGLRPRGGRSLHRGISLGIAVLSVTALLAGCGGSSGDTKQSGGAAPIVIGNIDTLTGPLASSEAGFKPAISAWADWTNAHGGIRGHQVRLVNKDDSGSPATSLTDVREMVSSNHVVAIFDATDSDVAWASYAASQGVPVISAFGHSGVGYNKYFFSSGTPLVPTGSYGAFATAKAAGGSRIAFLFCAEAAVCAQAAPQAKQSAQSMGLKFAYATSISSTAPNYEAQCLAAKSAGANILDVYAAAATQLNVSASCARSGLKFILDSSGLNVTKQWLTYPSTNNAVAESPFFPFYDTSTPATREFHSAMNAYAAKSVSSPSFGVIDAGAWVTGQLLARALVLAKLSPRGIATSSDVLTGLYAMKGETLGGIAPPLTFTQHANENANITCWFVISIKNSKFAEPQGLRPACEK